ncbi:MAG TPA: glycosyltransferase family 39 protein [Candidatus Saccharimonadales bacterium]|nr:glycosyltransferase family 39 protein [Candidatus Saccharimonadales bacterium]
MRLPRRSWIGAGLVFAAIIVIFLWRLDSWTPGLSVQEAAYTKSSVSWSRFVGDPVNAPHKLLQLLIFRLAPQHPSLLRLASVVFGLVFCLAFYRLAVSWFGRAIGSFSTLIFACLPLLTVSARQADGAVMLFCPIVFMALYSWLIKTKGRQTEAWFCLNLAAAVFIFTPGMLIWLAAAFLICRREIVRSIAQVPVWVSAAGLLGAGGAVAGLVLASIKHHYLSRQLLLIPVNFGNYSQILKHIGWMCLALFVRSGQTDPLIVGRLPVLDILLTALLIFGVYALRGAASSKAGWLAASGLYAILAAGLNNNLEMLALALPAISLFVSAGLRYLYIEWRNVFPRNPVPKNFALALIALVALTQLYFGLRYSLAAWPNTPATRAGYVLK